MSEQTARYIDIQMQQAGGPEDVFDLSVKELIHDFTGGVPRAIERVVSPFMGSLNRAET